MQERVTLTSSQQRIFFVDQNSGAKPIFNIVIPLKLTGQLDINNLKKAFFDVLNRHQILRMKCCQQHESLYGIITNNDFFKLNIVNFKNTQKSDKKALDFLSKKASKKFDLLKENLFKAYIINLADEEYILAIILHHIITDEWSNNVLVKDLFEFYNSYLENRIPELPKNFLEYSDYANEEQKLLSKGNFEESLRYWLENLKTAPEVSTLPTDKPRPDFLKHSGKSYSAILPESQLKGIKAFCSHQRLSLFTFLITIFKILLYRFSGQEDIVIGYPSANRLKEGTENIVGLFVNIIPLRSQFAQDISFIDFLEQTRTNLLEGYENQDFPFYQLISKIDQSRSLNHHPIFQILFTLNSETSSEISINGLQNESIPIESNFAKFDLSLFCKEEKGKLILNFNYSSELFNDSTIEKLFQLFSNILCLVMKNSEVKISEIPFLSPSEEEKLLKELSKKTNLYQYQNLTLHSMFVKVANSSPTNIAIITDESEYSYREIEDASNQFANYLLDSGIISNNKIAVSLEPSFELVVCLLGILKVGAIYVPIPAEYPDERVKIILKNSTAKLIITEDLFLEKFNQYKLSILNINKSWNTILSNQKYLIQKYNNEIACIIYTSGTTGVPKGVLYKHYSICNRAIWINKTYPFTDKDISIVLSSIGFVDFITELFIPLISGMKIVLPKKRIVKNPEVLLDYLSRYRISRVSLVPSLLRILLDNYSNLINFLPNLKHLEISGELFPENLMLETLKKFSQVKLINRYGATEATAVIYNELLLSKKDEIILNTKITANNRVFIVDKFLHLLPKNTIGELAILGASISKGYFKDSTLTSKKFTRCKIKTLDKEIVYKTGDLGYITSEGNIIIIGRQDGQIKINGQRVELSEIARVLEKHKFVKQAIIMNLQAAEESTKLVAYLIIGDRTVKDQHNLEKKLNSHLKRYLPYYMIPSSWFLLKKFPLNKNGKIDYKKLAEQFKEKINNEDYTPPNNNLEYKMTEIWQEFLRCNKVGITDNFFDLGGHSLLLIKVIAAMKNRLEVNVSINQFYQTPTIKGIISLIDKSDNKEFCLEGFKNVKEYKSLFEENLHTKLPLIANRYSYFFKRRNNLEFWNVCAAFEIHENPNIEAINKSTELLINYHEGLRLQIIRNEGLQQFIVGKEGLNPVLHLICKFEMNTENFKKFVERNVDKIQSNFTFPGELFKVLVVESKNDSFALIFIIHHLLTDIFSSRILIQDFFKFYNSIKNKEVLYHPIQTTSLIDYSAYSIFYWKQHLKNNLNYWRGLPWDKVINIPLDSPEEKLKNIEDFTSYSIRTIDAAPLIMSIKNVKQYAILEILLCAIGKAYNKWTGQNILNLALLCMGRENFNPEIDLSRTVGYIAEFIPILLQPTLNLQDFLGDTKRQIDKANTIGKSFGVAKYLSDNKKLIEEFNKYPDPEISLNFLWNFSIEGQEELKYLPKYIRDYKFLEYKSNTQRAFLISGGVFFKNDKFHISWDFSSKIFKQKTIDIFTEYCLEEFITSIGKLGT